jgi:DNA-binding transcriptional MerR regulator
MELIMSKKLKKSEISKILGLNKSTVRYYEQLGLITPEINENKYRNYGIEELKKLSQITFLKELGFSIEVISEILKGTSYNSIDILIDKKKYIEQIIQLHKKNIDNINDIIFYNQRNENKIDHQISNYQNRYLYSVKGKKESLSDLFCQNVDFFESNSLKFGNWFVMGLDADSFLNGNSLDFREYIEISNFNKFKHKDIVLIPGGKYLDVNITFKNDDQFEWEEVIQKTKKILQSESLKKCDQEILFYNRDNLNFNFENSKRIISIQIPVSPQ